MRKEDFRSLAPAKRFQPRPQPVGPPEVVDPGWILKAAGAVVALGVVCSYITLCLFFYAGQWQFVLHPSRTVGQTPASVGLAFQPVRFGSDVSGKPQLSGWWIPSDSPSDPVALMLHGQSGSMSDALVSAKALHDARLNVLLFDYRGYGQSGGRHPSEAMMRDDAAQALRFLTETREIPLRQVVVFGKDLGASLAVRLCAANPQIAGLILEDADGDTSSRVEADQRSRIVPVSLLFHERFPLADPLHTLRTPKLLISLTSREAPVAAQRAADPKITAELAPGADDTQVARVIRRFLDTYIAHGAPTLATHP